MTLWYNSPDTVDIKAILATYAAQFQRAPDGPPATGCICLSGLTAETDAEAEAMLAAAKEHYGRELIVNFCGSPERSRESILELAARHGVREVVIQAQYGNADQQERMFRLLGEVMLKGKHGASDQAAQAKAA